MAGDDEIRFVHREETFNDLAVRELAKSRSACICRLQFGACKRSECTSCKIGKEYRSCYEFMNGYDRTRLASYLSEYYKNDSLYPSRWMSYKNLCKHTFKYIAGIVIFLVMLILCVALMGPGDKPKDVSAETNNDIIITIILVHDYIIDLNNDGKVNCIDYACGFKLIWDEIYPDRKDDCIIIRNHSLTMNHLFNGVYEGNELIYIEPWTNDPSHYDMYEVWGFRWNPRYNKYDETETWLKEVGR